MGKHVSVRVNLSHEKKKEREKEKRGAGCVDAGGAREVPSQPCDDDKGTKSSSRYRNRQRRIPRVLLVAPHWSWQPLKGQVIAGSAGELAAKQRSNAM